MYNNIQNDILHQNIMLEDLKVYNNIQNNILHQNIMLEDLKVYNNIQNDILHQNIILGVQHTKRYITPKHNTGRSKGVQQHTKRYITPKQQHTKHNTKI